MWQALKINPVQVWSYLLALTIAMLGAFISVQAAEPIAPMTSPELARVTTFEFKEFQGAYGNREDTIDGELYEFLSREIKAQGLVHQSPAEALIEVQCKSHGCGQVSVAVRLNETQDVIWQNTFLNRRYVWFNYGPGNNLRLAKQIAARLKNDYALSKNQHGFHQVNYTTSSTDAPAPVPATAD